MGARMTFIMELLIYPAIHVVWKWGWEMKEGA